MLINSQINLIAGRLVKVYLFLLIFISFLPQVLFAEALPLITLAAEKNTSSLENLKIDDQTELLKNVKELQVQSQIMAKDYFYISQGLREDKARMEIKESAIEIDKILKILTDSIKDDEMQNLLSYLNGINLESKDVFNDSYSNENASLVIDFSETIYEGSQSIIEYLSKNTKSNDSLHDEVVQQKLILQRISKFYIAYQAGFTDETIFSKLAESVSNFEKGLKTISTYKFANDEQEFAYVRLGNYWSISKKFYEGMKTGELTLIVFVSTDHMMSFLDKMIKFENTI